MKSLYIRHIEAIGRSMYGAHRWQRPTARLLNVDRRTLGRWQAGQGSPDYNDVLSIIAAAKARNSSIQAAHDAALGDLRISQSVAPARTVQPAQSAPPYQPIRSPTIHVPILPSHPSAPLRRGWPTK